MKKLSILLMNMIWVCLLLGQTSDRSLLSVVNGSGTDGFVNLEWSVGEPFIMFHSMEFGILTEGFVQPNIVGLSFQNEISETIKVSCYPNPVSDLITIKFDKPQNEFIHIMVTDPMGNMVFSDIIPEGTVGKELRIGSFPDGIYFVRLINSDKTTFARVKIVKLGQQ